MSLACSSAFLAPNIELRETWEDIYTTGQKIGIVKDFLMLLKEVSYTYQGCIYLIKNTIKINIIKIVNNKNLKRNLFL